MSGGGMKCVYGVGVLTALVEEYELTEPDIMVASSGSVANGAYYLSGQYRDVIAAWLAVLGDKRLISFARKKVFDIDYLIDEIFKKRFPFDFKKLASSRTKFFFTATRVRDGKTVFMKLPKTKAIYEHLRAAKAIPFIYGKEVRIGRASYIDGDFGANTPDLVAKAITEGATHILVVEHEPNLDLKRGRTLMLRALSLIEKISGKKGIANAAVRELKTSVLSPQMLSRTIVLSPSKPLGLRTLSKSKLRLRKGFNLGYADATNSKELKSLLGQK